MMKVLLIMVLSVVLVGGMVGCGKTLGELRADSDAVVDNATGVANQTIGTAGTIAKQVIRAGFAVYDLVKKMFEDTQDNTGTVINIVTGASTTPAKP